MTGFLISCVKIVTGITYGAGNVHSFRNTWCYCRCMVAVSALPISCFVFYWIFLVFITSLLLLYIPIYLLSSCSRTVYHGNNIRWGTHVKYWHTRKVFSKCRFHLLTSQTKCLKHEYYYGIKYWLETCYDIKQIFLIFHIILCARIFNITMMFLGNKFLNEVEHALIQLCWQLNMKLSMQYGLKRLTGNYLDMSQ